MDYGIHMISGIMWSVAITISFSLLVGLLFWISYHLEFGVRWQAQVQLLLRLQRIQALEPVEAAMEREAARTAHSNVTSAWIQPRMQ